MPSAERYAFDGLYSVVLVDRIEYYITMYQSVLYSNYRVRHKNNPLRKLEFLENDQAYFAVLFIS